MLRKNRTVLISLVVLTVFLFGCSSGRMVAAPSPLNSLKDDIKEIFSDPNFFVANWGVYIESLNSGEIIYRENPYKLFMPASNMKLFTTAAALSLLGPEYRYSTKLLSNSESVENGILKGDILIRGSGDPSFSGRNREGNTHNIFSEWADILISKGINSIEGNIIGDCSAFDEEFYGEGWEYNDLSYWYAAPISGLSYNENVVYIKVTPGASSGVPPETAVDPPTQFVEIENLAETVNPTRNQRINIRRKSGSNKIVISGTISYDTAPVVRRISVDNPALYAITVFKETLEDKGISCNDVIVLQTLDQGKYDINSFNYVVADHVSPPLSELIKTVNKESHNFFADQIFKTLGAEFTGTGSFEAGEKVVKSFLGRTGINTDQFFAYDGSGLSRHNLVMPVQVAYLMKYMRSSEHFDIFYDSLPIAGVDGTIKNRMRNTTAENLVHAKTGTIHYVRALSGYVTSLDGEEFVVSVLVNHYTTPTSSAGALQDRLFIKLANFRRGR